MTGNSLKIRLFKLVLNFIFPVPMRLLPEKAGWYYILRSRETT